ncbi:hemerythrin domain-containing protein [Maribacter sp. ACAM166]|uniref:hemerythrin domain-containing protein n=1 Tax=Maribacter sp. ACAM166 TaxID=2508996 RepID=UPI0010FE733E|nr:hemerythrin domain-containing protein [Maribacter sp. ACAM166]TLP80189.1 hemerythrin domain-containing protein [Maribacter sp. ACAM166]
MELKKIKPIKRSQALQGVSREHHHGLLLCWKIRTGFSKGIAEERIKTYVDWFYITHLVPHFELEENHIFPILGNDHKMIKKALAQHKRLHRLFAETDSPSKSLSLIEEELEQHIRFEERVLFNEIQKIATEEQLQTILKIHSDEKFNDNTDDTFWI